MMNLNELSAAEKAAAQLFFNVCVQSAFLREDPNIRYKDVFKRTDMDHIPEAKTPADIVRGVYQGEFPDGQVSFEANPENTPAWSRVYMVGGRPKPVIDLLMTSMKGKPEFIKIEKFPLVLPDGMQMPEGNSADRYLLTIDPKLNTPHDVVFEFHAKTAGVEQPILDCLAWPEMKDGSTGTVQ